jgi:beta-lactamase superfamily II metal-dependent hydrolase
MATLIQLCTSASLYDGAFDNDVGWSAAGMGYIIAAEDDHFIVVDGGFSEDATKIIDILESHTSSSLPTVDLWIITHSHIDHYGALLEISQNALLRERLNIKQLCYYFPREFRDRGGKLCNILALAQMEQISAKTGAQYLSPSLDGEIKVGDVKLKFIYLPTDCEPLNDKFNSNLCSLVFTVEGKKKKALITADAFKINLSIILEAHRGRLGCDIIQLPHHALCDTGIEEFYKEVNAKTVLVPTSIAGNRAMNTIYYDQNSANRMAIENAERVIYAFEGTAKTDI